MLLRLRNTFKYQGAVTLLFGHQPVVVDRSLIGTCYNRRIAESRHESNEESAQMVKAIIILLTLATAAIHFSFFVRDPTGELIYGLNALGYLTLLAMLYLPIPLLDNLHRMARRILMGYAAITIVAYIIFGLVKHEWTVPLGPIDKLIEVTLIALLWQEDQQSTMPSQQ